MLVTLVLAPLLITFFVHIRIIIDAKKFMSQPTFKPSMAYKSDFSLVRSNFYSFLTFVIFWLPFVIIFSLSFSTSPRNITNKAFYLTAWIGLSKSCFHNLIYCVTNRHFRNAYFKLFNYCCCKTTVSTTRRRQQDVTRSDVRVHIIPGMPSTSDVVIDPIIFDWILQFLHLQDTTCTRTHRLRDRALTPNVIAMNYDLKFRFNQQSELWLNIFNVGKMFIYGKDMEIDWDDVERINVWCLKYSYDAFMGQQQIT